MKKISVFICSVLMAGSIFAQQKNPTTIKEVKDKQKQAQDALNALSPEQRKMMEQMGMKMPGALPAGTTDAQVALAVGGDAVPQKNTVLIGAIPKITLTAASVPAYIKSLNDYVEKSVSNDAKLFAQQIYTAFKTNKYDAATTGNVAIGYWASGNPEVAVYLMGRACADDATDADLLSNFAAMLSMGGAPHRAIPLLEYLSKLYPENTTIVNNLGQAWFYLGETDKANVQLDKVVKAFAYHPQANYTQCLIQESKGNTAGAIEKLKNSIKYSFSLDKFNKLRKLGYKTKLADLRLPIDPDPNPLGLQNFVRPEFPKSLKDELRLKQDWKDFQKQINDKTVELGKLLIPFQQNANQKAQQTYDKLKGKTQPNEVMEALKNSKTDETAPNNIYYQTARKALEEMNKDGGSAYRLEKTKTAVGRLMNDFGKEASAKRKELEKKFDVVATTETELAHVGESIGVDACKMQNAYSEWAYKTYNIPLENAINEYLKQLRIKLADELYWKQFVQNEQTFEATKIAAKKEWLAALASSYLETELFSGDNIRSCIGDAKESDKKTKLADFDDLNCKYKTVLDFKVYKQIFECGRSRIEFDAGKLSGNFNFKDNNKGKSQFEKCTIEATVIDKSVTAGKGPLQAGASVKAGMGMEISSHGVEDVYVTGEVKASAGAGPKEISVSVTGKMSLISGNTTGAISGFGK